MGLWVDKPDEENEEIEIDGGAHQKMEALPSYDRKETPNLHDRIKKKETP